MSGGSYDYLCHRETEELFGYERIIELERMEKRFIEMDYLDVARDFRRLIEYIKTAKNRVDVLSHQLNDLMEALEWYDSCDRGRDDLDRSVEQYRAR